MRQLLLLPIRFYQYAISPIMVSHCRHTPTCSQYAVEAIQHHGAFKGSYLAGARLLRCHPWGDAGYDPVPGTESNGDKHPQVTASPTEPFQSTTQTRH